LAGFAARPSWRSTAARKAREAIGRPIAASRGKALKAPSSAPARVRSAKRGARSTSLLSQPRAIGD
jgi:hypothetical protein